MSADAQEDAGLSRKEKRAKRDAERAEKFRDKGGKKRKAVQDVDEVEDGMQENIEGDVKIQTEDIATAGATESTDTVTKTKKASKKRKTKHDAQDESTQQKRDLNETNKKRKVESSDQTGPPSKKRFVVFIGNLPYSTTDTTLDAHFARLKPYTLRHRTDPKTKKSKGFAFIEFEDYDRLKTCLKIFHHSTFDPDNPGLNAEGDHSAAYGEDVNGFRGGRKKRSHARKINVELTAGGGGTTEARKEKILAKNTRLDEQRKRRAEAERKEKFNKERKRRAEDDKNKSGDTKEAKEDATGGIHPSRLARIAN